MSLCSLLSADSLLQWKAEGKAAVWLRVPISLSRCAAAASTHGFAFHHAKDDHTVLALWLGEGESRLPGFATHQVGVAGRDRWMKVHSHHAHAFHHISYMWCRLFAWIYCWTVLSNSPNYNHAINTSYKWLLIAHFPYYKKYSTVFKLNYIQQL